jgi:predicted dehydrogenase
MSLSSMKQKQSSDIVRCAVIGCGRIGSSLEDDRLREKPASHAGAIAYNRDTRLVGGVDPDPDARSAFAKRWHLAPVSVFENAERMLETLHPDIVHIASDTETHIPLLETCLAAGVPVIVLEKPVGVSLEEARRALPRVEKAEREGRSRVIVNHERRFSLDYRMLRSIIASGELGTLRAIHSRLYMGLNKPPAQVLWHDGTHLVDIITFLAGPWDVTAVQGDPEDRGNPFMASGKTRERVDAALVTLDCSPGRDFLGFELDVDFSSGRIRAGNGIWEVWKSEPSPWYEAFRSLRPTKDRRWRKPRKTGYFANMMAHAVACVRDPAEPAESSFRDGLAALELLDSIRAKRTIR